MNDERKDGEIKGEGFAIKDRRKFTAEGEPKPDAEPDERAKGDTSATPGERDGTARDDVHPLPEVTFSTFVLSLSTSCFLHFGEIADPITKKKERNLAMAKQAIDTLAMLKEKTKGNLNKEEEELIDTILYTMRIKYVDEAKKS